MRSQPTSPKRALLLVLDSVGVGDAPDAAQYGDESADTLGHILRVSPDLKLPHLDSLGLARLRGVPDGPAPTRSAFGRMRERSAGKDTTTGHWEIAGIILEKPFPVFEKIPSELVRAIESETNVIFLGNYPQSGTVILEELGAEHARTGHPILYTSADSVLQIAAHEDVIPIQQLTAICEAARRHADAYQIGRVIARPFTGVEGAFQRTPRRHDYSLVPPPMILNALMDSGTPVIGIGKISDIFAGRGISESFPTASNAEGMQTIDRLWESTLHGLLFANLVDFDMLYGHRRDVQGYANALVEFDHWLGHFLPQVGPEDFLLITADHGNDPTHPGTDHTREEVPLLVCHGAQSGNLGTRDTFADVASALGEFFDVAPERRGPGRSFLSPQSH